MNKIIKGLIFALFISLVAMACRSERGEISVTLSGREEYSNEPVTWVPMSVGSTFRRDVDVHVFVGGIPLMQDAKTPYKCRVKAESITECALIPLPGSGKHTIRVETINKDGDVVSDETTYRVYSKKETDIWFWRAAGIGLLASVICLFVAFKR